MREWGEGHNAEHGHHEWGADPCARCTADTYDPWEALVHAAEIMGWIEASGAPSPSPAAPR